MYHNIFRNTSNSFRVCFELFQVRRHIFTKENSPVSLFGLVYPLFYPAGNILSKQTNKKLFSNLMRENLKNKISSLWIWNVNWFVEFWKLYVTTFNWMHTQCSSLWHIGVTSLTIFLFVHVNAIVLLYFWELLWQLSILTYSYTHFPWLHPLF